VQKARPQPVLLLLPVVVVVAGDPLLRQTLRLSSVAREADLLRLRRVARAVDLLLVVDLLLPVEARGVEILPLLLPAVVLPAAEILLLPADLLLLRLQAVANRVALRVAVLRLRLHQAVVRMARLLPREGYRTRVARLLLLVVVHSSGEEGAGKNCTSPVEPQSSRRD
jgi:hypothetical protein